LKIATHDLAARHPAAKSDAPDALRETSITIQKGEHVAIIGASGAGKTTLLHTIACALTPTRGALALDGVDPWKLTRGELHALRAKLYLAPQVPPLPPRQRVVTAVLAGALPAMSFWQSVASLFYPRDIAGAYRALEAFDLSEKLFDRVDRLSGGERQRVGLARALLSPASLWLVDEPLSALDPKRAELAISTLTSEAKARGVTLITTLHQVDVALTRFERIIGLASGVVEFDLPANAVTRAMLEKLYAQHPDELDGPAPDLTTPATDATKTAPVVMHCR
jgi:phosphonate transport system ATP-binding protein